MNIKFDSIKYHRHRKWENSLYSAFLPEKGTFELCFNKATKISIFDKAKIF